MPPLRIPALIGQADRPYQSIERRTITGCDGDELADACVVQPILVPPLARKAQGALDELPLAELLAICKRAAHLFATGRPDGDDLAAYTRRVSLATGLPLGVVQGGAAELLPRALTQMEGLLAAQLGGEPAVLDSRVRERNGIPVGYVPRGRQLGVVMPGNHPSTHVLWLIALALKVPVLLRPSFEDPFTPYRLAASLLAAGLPPAALSFVPGEHDLVESLVQRCDLSVLFGGPALAEQYGGRRDTLVYGPGRSKAIVLADAPRTKALDALVRLLVDEGGRGCINCSSILVEGDVDALAAELAARLDAIPARHPLDAAARLPAARSAEAAEQQSAILAERAAGAREWTRAGATADANGVTIQRPRLFSVDSPAHPLYGVELPFPFAVVAPCKREHLVAAARNSLAVVVIGEDEALLHQLLLEPSIDKIYGRGALSTEFDPLEPHEGYLADFLFEHKAFR